MKGKTAFNAMEGIDPRYILEAAPDAVVRKGSKAPYIRILAVAATVAVLTAVAVLGAGILKQSGDNPPVVPPVGESQDMETPTDGGAAEGTESPTVGEPEVPPVLNGSYSTDLYAVEEIDGKHYLSFVDGNEKPQGGSNGNASVIKGIYFNSLEEMRRKFLKGDFTEQEVLHLKSELKLTDKGFEIPDMTNLYDAVLPEGWSVYRAFLDGGSIYLSVRNDQTYNEAIEDYSGESGFIAIHTDQYYDVVYQNDFLAYIEKNEKYTVQDETSFRGLPCRIFERLTNDILRKDVVMEVPFGDGKFDVLVKYRIQQSDIAGTAAPYCVSMFGEVFGQKIEIYLSGFESDPQGDFYQAFGIKPFETKE